MCTLVLSPRIRAGTVAGADDVGGDAPTYTGVGGAATDEGSKSAMTSLRKC